MTSHTERVEHTDATIFWLFCYLFDIFMGFINTNTYLQTNTHILTPVWMYKNPFISIWYLYSLSSIFICKFYGKYQKKGAKTQNFRNVVVVVAFQKFGLLPTFNPAEPHTTHTVSISSVCLGCWGVRVWLTCLVKVAIAKHKTLFM